MKNIILNKVKLVINGKNIYNFIIKIKKKGINIYDISIISNKKAYIVILESDVDKVLKLKSTYEVLKIDTYGLIKVKMKLVKFKYIIISLLLTSIFIFILSKMIFAIEVVHTNIELKQNLEIQLKEYGIYKFSFAKDYEALKYIKEEILNNNKETIEWLEIVNIGNKYIVKFEERIIPQNNNFSTYQDIIASKSAIIKNISVESGERIKSVNDYVKEGDIIVSGLIYLEDKLKNIVEAKALVYGEVWYRINIEFPLFYTETLYSTTNKKQFKLEVLNLKSTDEYNFLEKIIFKIEHNLLPIKFSYGNYSNEIVNEYIYTQEEAIEEALNLSREKILSTLDLELNESIISENVLSFQQINDKINIEIFYKVYEIISETKSISVED